MVLEKDSPFKGILKVHVGFLGSITKIRLILHARNPARCRSFLSLSLWFRAYQGLASDHPTCHTNFLTVLKLVTS